MRRLRLPRKTAIVLAAVAAVLVVPHAAQRADAPAGHGSGRTAITATTVADITPAGGGLCSVPGIGDIGGLLGFCALGTSGLTGDLNNICQPSLPDPEPANSGIDSMVAPPASGKQPATLYDEYGVAGDYWAATNLQCSDMTSLIGNNVAGMVFDAAKSIDRVTITVYQSAAGEGILSWLQRVADKLITSLGNAIYFPYLAIVVIIAAIWLAWQGLIRKRGTRTIEGTVWMVAACAAAIFLIGKPADVTGIGRGVSDGVSQALNVAFAKLPSPGPSSCVPVQKGDPQVTPASYSYTSGNTVVDQNADELWTVLVCKPWLVGEFGTSAYSTGPGKPNVVTEYGRSLLWAQAIAVNEKPTPALIQAKQATFAGIASSIQANDPAVYPLFQGKQWTTRLEVAFAAMFAAVVAGVLVLLISVTLILLKLSFLLLLIVGPFFLLVGAHPGFGRVVALRWVEMLIGVLLKQAAVALVLSVLLYCYALIMGTSDAVLPWALKILMIALVTLAAFIYRKPFQHLFSAVGYGVIGSQERAEADMYRAGATARANTVAAATLAVPPFAAYRAGRWARRHPGQAASLAVAATAGGTAVVAAGLQAGNSGSAAAGDAAVAADGTLTADGAAVAGNGTPAGTGGPDGAGGRMTLAARARASTAAPASPQGSAAEPPPLNLPSRNGAGTSASAGPTGGTTGAAVGPASSAPAGQAPGVWPGGRSGIQASPPPARQPGVAPPRQAGSASSGGRLPVRSQPPQSQPSQQQSARAQPARAQPARAQPGPRQPAGSGRVRSRWSAAPASQRQSGSAAPRRQGGPATRGQSAPTPPETGQRTSAAERPGPWQGQPMTGPLASGDSSEAERRVPFWLRPMRRK
jgi:hypothetical protein